MEDLHLGAVESRFADLIWRHAPLASSELAHMAAEALGWKKSTTYTVLRRLCDRGLFENRGGTVCPRLSRAEFYARRSEQFVAESFQGSLPAFLAAFSSRKKLSEAEIAELERLIDEMKGDAKC